MGEHDGVVQERALVNDDGQWYETGTIVRIERAPSARGQFRLVVDGRGNREVLGCRRFSMDDRPMLTVTLRRT